MIPVLGSPATPNGDAGAPGQQAAAGLPGLFAELLALAGRPAEAGPASGTPFAGAPPAHRPAAQLMDYGARADAVSGLVNAVEKLIADADAGLETPDLADARAALQTLADTLAARSPVTPTSPDATGDTALAALTVALAEPATAVPGAVWSSMAPATAQPSPLSGMAARLDALAGRIAAVAPGLADGIETLAADLRALLPSRPAPPTPDMPLASRAAPDSTPAPPKPPPGSQAQAQAQTQAQAPAQSTPPALPPEIAARLVATADADPARSQGIDRPMFDVRPDAALTARPAAPVAGAQPARFDLPALAVEIVRRFHAGADRFQIRLDPPELGRVDVRLDIDGSRVAARLTVDRPDTLELLQRDARTLERALAQAGLSDDRPTLEFALRQNPFDRGTGNSPGAGPDTAPRADTAETPPADAAAYRGTVRPGGIDLYA